MNWTPHHVRGDTTISKGMTSKNKAASSISYVNRVQD